MRYSNWTRRSLLRGLTLTAGAAAGSTLVARSALAAAYTEPPIATTKLGKIRGFIDNGICAFKGIPYGDDTAKRRFMAAVPPPPWSGTRDTLKSGPRAPQPATRAPTGRAPARGPSPFNVVSKVIDDPRGEERKLFSQVPYENPGT
jgi:hypothetical protein